MLNVVQLDAILVSTPKTPTASRRGCTRTWLARPDGQTHVADQPRSLDDDGSSGEGEAGADGVLQSRCWQVADVKTTDQASMIGRVHQINCTIFLPYVFQMMYFG
jgi:hypothetical protein